MSNLDEAYYLLDNIDHSMEDSHRLVTVTEAQVRATMAVAEAQTLANLIAFLNWSVGQGGPKIPYDDYDLLRKEVLTKVKEIMA